MENHSLNKERIVKYTSITALISNILILLTLKIEGLSERLGWGINGYVDTIKTPLFDFEKWQTIFSIQVDSFLVFENYVGNNIIFPTEIYTLYGLALLIGFSIFLGSISGLTRIWHAVLFGIFALLIGTLHLENFQILSSIHDKAFTGVVLLIYIIVSYFFHIKNEINFTYRFLCYLIIGGIISLIVSFFGNTEYWIAESVSYSFGSLTILSLMFLVFISTAIPFGILFLTSFKNTGGSNGDSIKHFYVFYIIYSLNLVYAYLVEFHSINWDLYYLPPSILFVIATIVGLYIIKQQEDLFNIAIRESQIIYWVYLGGSIIATATYCFHLAIFDTSFTHVMDQSILILFIGFGFVSVIYISYNFYDVLKKNLPAYKVAFKPQNIDFLSTWGVGLLLSIGLFYINNFNVYRNSWVAYYNGLGDVELLQDNAYLAEERYNFSNMYNSWNFKGNYMLGSIAEQNKKYSTAFLRFDKSSKETSSSQAFIKAAQLQINDKNLLEAILILQKGLQKFPSDKEIYNNLALSFYEINEIDSALYYLDKGQKISGEESNILSSNFLGIATLSKTDITELEGHLNELTSSTKVSEAVNQLAYLNSNTVGGNKHFIPEYLNDSILNGDQVSYIYNYTINTTFRNENNDIDKYISKYLNNYDNSEYKQQLLFASALNNLNSKKFYSSWSNFDELSNKYGQTNGYYDFLLGLNAFQNNKFELAYEHLNTAFKTGQTSAIYPLALVASQLKSKEEGKKIWENVFKLNMIENPSVIKYYLDNDKIRDFTAADYVNYIVFNHKSKSVQDLFQHILKISSEENQIELLELLLQNYISNKETDKAIALVKEIETSFTINNELASLILNTTYLLDLPSLNNDDLLKVLDINSAEGKLYNDIYKNTNFLKMDDIESLFWNDAFGKFYSNKLIIEEKTEEAYQLVSDLLKVNPYSEIATANYIRVCFKLGLKDYAESSRLDAEYLLASSASNRINELYSRLKIEYQKEISTWE
ncbi:tetratricopeptide repeat protein [Flammeovirga kamogawensis]|uniref:Tetratricopeptide repeat protein n=1 Tax=Flammeovirga kamogawensis TaxID=373891 RepID=A0ABX8GS50_9BACT|nr:hypothetical protein [Flammeovirga kamogawensis]MBB6464086.1 hypothetical protein [Flammeovirga kamogawensis]QWG06128.1 hypothetical protein KM029_12300 [Flammeovirga kamogawensis]TRX67960.1 hypothetical protein EO216_07325 [Flammeovirga kamogawensis]